MGTMIGAGEVVVIALIGLLLVLSVGGVGGLVFWGRWVARRQGGGVWNRLAWLPIVAVGVQVVTVCVTSALLIRAFSSLDTVAPERRAGVLASSIEHVVPASAVFVGIGVLLFIASIIAFIIGSARPPATNVPSSPSTRDIRTTGLE
jgi:hypothetical protein